jgi:tRNA pseudouridine-54 N-methylase
MEFEESGKRLKKVNNSITNLYIILHCVNVCFQVKIYTLLVGCEKNPKRTTVTGRKKKVNQKNENTLIRNKNNVNINIIL